MIVTFYSYKGGVGRSMAMANVADILARRGARVLMIDFDLEAPGLEQYFQIHQPSARRHLGLLDLLLEFKHAMSVGSGEAASADFRDVRRFILPVYERLPGDGCLDLMPAGEREDPAQLERYALNVRSFDWQDFYFNWEGELFFEWLRGQLVPERYDLVLVDSRTGVTEMGGICAYQLGDVIVMMCAANHQNVRGTQNVAADFLSPQVLALRQNRPPQIVVVPARIEQRRQELLDEFMARFEATFGDRVPEALRARGMGFADLLVPYEPQYAFDERILADPANVAQRERIATAFHRLADAMTYLAAPGTRLAALARDAGGTAPQVAAQYDLTARFAGYDAYIVTATADSATAEAFAAQLKRADLRAFVDELEAVPPPEWQRRSEQQLFHSRALVVFIGPGGLTPAQSEGLQRVAAAVRASREFVTIKVLLPGASLAPTPGRQGTALGGEFFDLRDGVPANGLDPLVTRIAALAPARPAPADAGAPPEGADADYTLTWTTGGTAVAVSSPFRPLERFQEHDAAFFFGRDGLRTSLLDHLRTQARVWVLGPSGSGKRSLVMAGAFSELRRSHAADATRRLERIVPGADPVASLTRVLARLAPGADADARHVLFVDELEKVFAPDFDAGLRTRFLERVAALARERPDIVTVLAVRSDFVRALARTPLPVPADDAGVVRIGDLTRDELRQAIEKPTARAGLTFEPGLVDRIIEDLGTEAFRLPLLQLVLQSLYERRREGFLTNAAYDDMGGVRGLLVARADAAMDGLNDAGARARASRPAATRERRAAFGRGPDPARAPGRARVEGGARRSRGGPARAARGVAARRALHLRARGAGGRARAPGARPAMAAAARVDRSRPRVPALARTAERVSRGLGEEQAGPRGAARRRAARNGQSLARLPRRRSERAGARVHRCRPDTRQDGPDTALGGRRVGGRLRSGAGVQLVGATAVCGAAAASRSSRRSRWSPKPTRSPSSGTTRWRSSATRRPSPTIPSPKSCT